MIDNLKNENIYDVKCLFCKIINAELPADIIKETNNILAFRDINPQAKSHVLIIPKIHIASSKDINKNNSNYFVEMALMANIVSKIEGIYDKGFRWVINTGDDGGQTVNHIHLHLLGGRKLIWPPG